MLKDKFSDYYNEHIENLIDEEISENEGKDKELSSRKNVMETVKRVWKIRGGKKIRKKVTDRPGYKISGDKEVRISPQEKRARKKGSKKRLRKMGTAGKARAQRKKKKSEIRYGLRSSTPKTN